MPTRTENRHDFSDALEGVERLESLLKRVRSVRIVHDDARASVGLGDPLHAPRDRARHRKRPTHRLPLEAERSKDECDREGIGYVVGSRKRAFKRKRFAFRRLHGEHRSVLSAADLPHREVGFVSFCGVRRHRNARMGCETTAPLVVDTHDSPLRMRGRKQ